MANTFTVTAIVEGVAGLLLLISPSVPLSLLLCVPLAAPETIFIARLAGAALLAIGVISYLARNDRQNRARFGVLIGVLIYNVAATSLLAYAGSVLNMAGIALWPAVVFHAALAGWCIACVRNGGESS